MGNPQNVTRLKQNSVYEKILAFLDDKEINSINTRIHYEFNYKHFFKFMVNKELHELTEEDLDFDFSDILSYRKHLTETYANSSVNQKIGSLKSLYNFFEKNKFKVTASVFDLNKLPEHESRGYGVLLWEEVVAMIELVKSHYKGQEKSLLIELAAKTSMRLNSLLEMKWNDIQETNGVYTITVVDKGKKHIKSILPELYDRLTIIKGKNGERVFGLTTKTIGNMMKTLVREIGIDERRNICFHSLKKCGIEEVYRLSGGDLKAVANQGNHSPTTYIKYYQHKSYDPTQSTNLLIGQELDFTKLDNLTKEELLELIKDKLDRKTQIDILNKLP